MSVTAKYNGTDAKTGGRIIAGDIIERYGSGWTIVQQSEKVWEDVLRDLIGNGVEEFTHNFNNRILGLINGKPTFVLTLVNDVNGYKLYYNNGKFYRFTNNFKVLGGNQYQEAVVIEDEENLIESIYGDYDEYVIRKNAKQSNTSIGFDCVGQADQHNIDPELVLFWWECFTTEYAQYIKMPHMFDIYVEQSCKGSPPEIIAEALDSAYMT